MFELSMDLEQSADLTPSITGFTLYNREEVQGGPYPRQCLEKEKDGRLPQLPASQERAATVAADLSGRMSTLKL